jgi:chromosome partitioning protein
MISILVVNPKGGCGKTTIAANLAAAFANGDLRTVLADLDRQRSSSAWLKLRPKDAAVIEGDDWVSKSKTTKVKKRVQRLVIDGPAAIRKSDVADLITRVDVIVLPVLPSVFDENATRSFIEKLNRIKPIHKGRTPLAVVGNRMRPNSRAAQRLELFFKEIGQTVATRLSDRAVYGELACQGLSIFDMGRRYEMLIQNDWLPLIRFIENAVALRGQQR